MRGSGRSCSVSAWSFNAKSQESGGSGPLLNAFRCYVRINSELKFPATKESWRLGKFSMVVYSLAPGSNIVDTFPFASIDQISFSLSSRSAWIHAVYNPSSPRGPTGLELDELSSPLGLAQKQLVLVYAIRPQAKQKVGILSYKR